MKIIIFDSSTIINFVMNGLTEMLKDLKRGFLGKMIITKEVKWETIDRPLQIKKFELGALKVQELLLEGILEMPESVGVSSDEISEKTRQMTRDINQVFSSGNDFIHIIDAGEVSCLALSMIASQKGIENAVAVDERTTRMLGEKPENLYQLFEKKLHTKITFHKQNIPKLSKIKFIRSSEIVYVAWKKNLIKIQDKRLLDALLYATKFKGSAISREEIEEIKSLG